MNKSVNIEEVKAYNGKVKEYRDKASKIQANVEFNQTELSRLCKELSVSLGKEVNENNIEQVYNEYVDKINNTLQTGNDIIKRIQNEESAISSTVAGVAAGMAPVAPTPMQNMAPTAPVAPVAPQMPNGAPAGFFTNVGNNGFPAPQAPANNGNTGFGGSIFGDNGQLNPGKGFMGI